MSEKEKVDPHDLRNKDFTASIKDIVEGRTTSRVIEDIYLCLVKNPEYRGNAFSLMYKIPIYQPTPYFDVKKSDVTQDLHDELSMYDPDRQKFIMNQAIGKIFEILDSDYYFGSVAKCLRWRWIE